MKKILISLSILAIVGSVQGQTKTTKPAAKKPVAPKVNENTLLWEITGNGLKKPSYIFGTMHLLCSEDANLSPNLKKAIRQSDQIYFEIDLDDMSQMMSALKYVRMKDNTKLSDLITKEEYERIKKYFNDHPSTLPFSMMERFKPYMVTSLISESGLGCEKTNGMEMVIMQEANLYGKEILGLETTEYQAGLFDSIPYSDQAKELVKYIDSVDSYKKNAVELLTVYKKQDLKKMLAMTQSDPSMEKYLDLLLYNRNRHWMQQLQFVLRTKPTLIAVGAGHLPGEQGMLSLLKKSGFAVKPIPNIVPGPKKST